MTEHQFLLGDYPDETVERYELIVETVKAEYPSVLATPLEFLIVTIQDEEYAKALKSFVDMFELAVPFATAVVLHDLKKLATGSFDSREPFELLAGKVLTIGSWFEIFRRLMKLGAQANITLAASFEKQYRKTNGGLTRFGKAFDSIPAFRNKFLGHDTAQSDEVAYSLLREHEGCLFEFLESLSPLKELVSFTLMKAIRTEEDLSTYRIQTAVGLNRKNQKVWTSARLHEDDYYLIHADKLKEQIDPADIVPLRPLVVHISPHDDGGKKGGPPSPRFAYLFQSKTSNAKWLSYITPDQWPRKDTAKFTDAFRDFFRAFLGDVLDEVGIPRQKRKKQTWAEYYESAARETRKFVGDMKSKYDKDLYVARRETESICDQFLASEKVGFVLLGASGSGKTNVLCHFAEALLADGHIVATYYSKVFTNFDLAEKVQETFDVSESLNELLSALDKAAEAKGKNAVFIFDAVNECIPQTEAGKKGFVTPASLIGSIDRVLVSKGFRHIKVVMSCRNYTWEESKRQRGYGINTDLYFTTNEASKDADEEGEEWSLGGFTDEEFREAYSRYAKRFDLKTPLEMLLLPENRFLRYQLLDPFRLKLVSECYQGRTIPQKANSLALLEEQFKEVTERLEKAKGFENMVLLDQFTRYLRERNFDAVALTDLAVLDDQHPLKKSLFGDYPEPSRALDRLIEEGILRIEEGTSFHELRFVYERFHEYLLAKVMLKEFAEKKEEDEIDLFVIELESVKDYAVNWGAIRNALIIHHKNSDEGLDTIWELAGSTAYGAQGVVIETIHTLAQDDYEAAYQILEHLIRTDPAHARLIKDLHKLEARIGKLGKPLRLKKAKHVEAKTTQLEQLQEERTKVLAKLNPGLAAKTTAIKALYDIYRSRAFIDNLYDENLSPLKLLWQVLADPLDKIRDCATKHIYYLWTEYPDVSFEILRRLSESYLESGFFGRYSKEHIQKQLEPCARLSGLYLCESLVLDRQTERLGELREIWKNIIQALSVGGLAKPFIGFVARRILFKGTTVISEYVNNITEYQHFWDNVKEEGDGFTRKDFRDLVRFLDPNEPGFEEAHDTIVQGAALGDSFANLLLERVLIAQGSKGYEHIADVVDRIYKNPDNLTPDYTQMSMLYVIFHTLDKMESVPEEPFRRFGGYLGPWTDRTFGYFSAHYNDEANNGEPYKQYTLNWYGALHSKLYGDGQEEMTFFQDYLREGFEEADTHKFLYAVDNIAMLAADFGYWKSALKLFEFTLSLFKRKKDLRRFKKVQGPGPAAQASMGEGDVIDIKSILARSLATIRGYYGVEVDRFVMDELATTSFPGFEAFRSDLMRYEAQEGIGDLMTHKFGNLFVYGIVNVEAVRTEIQTALTAATEQKTAIAWLGWMAKHFLNVMFDLNIRA